MLTPSFLNAVGAPGLFILAATKDGLSAELLARRIRVNAVSPGPINTPFEGKLGRVQQHRNTRRLALRVVSWWPKRVRRIAYVHLRISSKPMAQ